MSEIVLPLALRFARSGFKYIDQTGVTRGIYTGAVQTTGYGGDRVGCSLEFTPTGGSSTAGKSLLAQLRSFLMFLRGQQNRVFIADDSNVRRGSFPASELFANADFSNGTNGWSIVNGALTANDGVLRIKATAGNAAVQAYQSLSYLQYTPYVERALITAGQGFTALSIGPFIQDAVAASTNYTIPGYAAVARVMLDTGPQTQIPVNSTSMSAFLGGDYINLHFASFSRCFLADGGSNDLLRSDEFDNAAWTKNNVTVSANTGSTAAPDGTATADNIVETTATSSHSSTQAITIAAEAHDRCWTIALKTNGRSFCWLQLGTATGTTFAFFNLTTGATGTTSTGTGWSNLRTGSRNMGNGWWQFSIIARKTSADTALTVYAGSAVVDGTSSYTGSVSFGMFNWRGTCAASSAPVRLRQTTTVAVAADSQPASAIYVKGLPVSTSGLLLQGDWIEIDGQLKMVIEPLDSDALSGGYLQFSPPLARTVADNTPIIVNRPMGRFMLAGDAGWANEPGVFSNASIEFEEALS